MAERFRLPTLAALLLAGATGAPNASAFDGIRMEPMWLPSGAQGGAAGAPPIPALLSVPPGWLAGDAAAVILSDGPWPGLVRDRLISALLEEGAAVLELDTDAARGFSPENARMEPLPGAAELAADLRGAVDGLQRDAAAGLVVAIGRGSGGDAAVLAADDARQRPSGDGLAAGAHLGPGPAAFALGGVPLEGSMGVHRGWPARATRLCGVLGRATVDQERRAEADCRRALLGGEDAGTLRVAGP